jgi:hypothetical protein
MRASGALLTHEQVEEWLTNGNLPALPNVQDEPQARQNTL